MRFLTKAIQYLICGNIENQHILDITGISSEHVASTNETTRFETSAAFARLAEL